MSDDELLKLLESEEALAKLIAILPEGQRDHLQAMADEVKFAVRREDSQENFLAFVKAMWPNFIFGRHHAVMCRKFEEIASGKLKRLIINMPPRHTKSEFASYLLPAWFLGKYPDKKVIQSSNTAELAVGFGRKVRNLVGGDVYSKIFPNVALQSDSKAAGRWSTNAGGEYFAIGVGGTVTGKGADLLIIDDPHSEQEAAFAAQDPSVYDKVYEWFTSGPRQRLQPGGAIIIVMCMTGDTSVLMGDGATFKLKDVRPGDVVATYENNRLTTAKINNWRSSGVDSIVKIQTQSGIVLHANERHPFLVDTEGKRTWTRVKDLKPGMLLVTTKDVRALQDHKQNPESVQPANLVPATTEDTRTHPIIPLGTMENGKVLPVVLRDVLKLSQAAAYVLHITAKNTLQKNLQTRPANIASKTATELLLNSTKQWLKSAVTGVTYAGSRLLQRTQGRIGTESSASTTATTQKKSEDCYAMTATLQSGTEKPLKNCAAPLSTYSVTLDPIVDISPAGEAEVFDVEVDRTENFIANGAVSHNTRWGKRDLTGQALKAAAQRGGDEWEVVEFPAILPSGKPLWPEFWSLTELEALKTELPNAKWQAQYQQTPTSESSAIVKREWWRIWQPDAPPVCDFTLMAWDTAFEKNNRADYSACTIWGVFYHPDDSGKEQAQLILLNAFRDRVEFPDLKKLVIRQYNNWEPDSVIIEKKASGAPLIYELRAMGIPVQEFTPVRGNDKITRLNAVSDLFASGRVWAPNTNWAEEVIDEVASFPAGDHDDYVDSTSLALMRFRQGGYVRTNLDEEEPVQYFKRKLAYY